MSSLRTGEAQAKCLQDPELSVLSSWRGEEKPHKGVCVRIWVWNVPFLTRSCMLTPRLVVLHGEVVESKEIGLSWQAMEMVPEGHTWSQVLLHSMCSCLSWWEQPPAQTLPAMNWLVASRQATAPMRQSQSFFPTLSWMCKGVAVVVTENI